MATLAGLYVKDEEDYNYVSLSSILPSDVCPAEVMNLVEQWLDENCSNEPFYWWTNFGTSLHWEARRFAERLEELWKYFGFIS